VATKLSQVSVNAAKQSSPRAAASIITARPVNTAAPKPKGNPQYTLQDQGILNNGCSRHMTGNKSFLTDYQEIDGGFVAFGGSPKGGNNSEKKDSTSSLVSENNVSIGIRFSPPKGSLLDDDEVTLELDTRGVE
ncbi:hypothetical protein Tco_0628546, partial [Tanacetum coccineum]